MLVDLSGCGFCIRVCLCIVLAEPKLRDRLVMATQEETTPAATETTQPESNEAAPSPASAEATPADAAAEPAAEAAPAAAEEPAAAAAAADPPVTPRVVIVTGASSGLGLEVSRVLCDAGHDVVMACRNEDKANRAIEKLKKQNLKGSLTYMHVC